MATQTYNFTTGPTILPDVGQLTYNGCTFSPLFETNVSGNATKDNAQRTTKYVDLTITADGYVTLPTGTHDISATMETLYNLLTAQGGALLYQGRGFNIDVNRPGSSRTFGQDVAWGPVPEVLEFQPLGGGLSAKIKWQVKVRIPKIAAVAPIARLLLQFNYETSVAYDEAGFSTLSIKGTAEVPLTRSPSQTTRTLTYTVDEVRRQIEIGVMSGIDLRRFRVIRREFNVSRDKRTLEWDVAVEEKPYMDLPPFCTIARGSYSVRPAKAGMGLCLWLCTLRTTYTVAANAPRRAAWVAFLALLRLRMQESALGVIPPGGGNQNPGPGAQNILAQGGGGAANLGFQIGQAGGVGNLGFQLGIQAGQQQQPSRKAWLIDFSFDEGIYLDSKTTVSFSATWRLVTIFSAILRASGLWRKLPENNLVGAQPGGQNLWARSMGSINGRTPLNSIQGVESWLPNRLDPALDFIIDFGSP